LTSIVLACLDSPNLNYSNRPVRTRMPGGVGGASQHAGCPYPDCMKYSFKYAYKSVYYFTRSDKACFRSYY
ncbi:MAG: hypothetical protein AB1437_25040, partial [Pseudomonadota bacterium]